MTSRLLGQFREGYDPNHHEAHLAAGESAGTRPDEMGLRREALIGSLPTPYGRTALWAKAIHDQFDVDGLIWTSNLCEPDAAVLLFGDRAATADLAVTGIHEGSDGSFLADVRKASERGEIVVTL